METEAEIRNLEQQLQKQERMSYDYFIELKKIERSESLLKRRHEKLAEKDTALLAKKQQELDDLSNELEQLD